MERTGQCNGGRTLHKLATRATSPNQKHGVHSGPRTPWGNGRKAREEDAGSISSLATRNRKAAETQADSFRLSLFPWTRCPPLGKAYMASSFPPRVSLSQGFGQPDARAPHGRRRRLDCRDSCCRRANPPPRHQAQVQHRAPHAPANPSAMPNKGPHHADKPVCRSTLCAFE